VLRGLRSIDRRARIRRIDSGHTNPYQEWVELGSPEDPTPRQLRRLEDASELAEEPLKLTRDLATGYAAFKVSRPAESVAAVHVAA
jgi:beta-xylosidase